MSISRWVIAVVFCLAFASLGQAQSAGSATEGEADQQQTPARTLPLPFPVQIIEDETEAEARQRRENIASQREIDDLAAQQGMNTATQAMNEATQRIADDSRQMTIATWVGVVLLLVTLVLTLMANKAAIQAVKVTETIGMTQMRAWLSFTDWQLEGTGADGAVEGFHIVLKWRNTGATPALNVNAVTGFKEKIQIKKRGEIVNNEDSRDSIVGPGLPFITKVLISPEDLFNTKDNPAIIQCFLRYDAVFEPLQSRETVVTFRVRYIGRASLMEVKKGRISHGNFMFQPIGSDSDRMT